MTTLHIPFVDETLVEKLERIARSEHSTLEEVVRGYLERIVNQSKAQDSKQADKNVVLEATKGAWTEEQAAEFEHNTEFFRKIDSNLWP